MAKRTSSAAIGFFVTGGLALIVAAIVVLGSGRLFRQERKFICFFQGGLNGLKVGAPVKIRGVEIGSVSEIRLGVPPDYGKLKQQASVSLPVVIEINESQVKNQGGTATAVQPGALPDWIKRGLRAQLNTESLLTGLLYVDLDLHPGTPLNLALEPGTAKYPEIPTIPTDLEQVQDAAMKALARLDKIDFDALVKSITYAANAANQLLSSPDIKATLASLKDTTATLNKVVISVHEEIADLNNKADPLIASMKKTSDDADQALVQARATMQSFQNAVAPGSPLAYRLDVTLDNLSEASSTIRQLADFLQRNPSALVRGRYAPDNSR
ncbi:MAG TPA: MlaD family protein [Candidatus Binataceae bacterium]|nr:MlaD family protein [Candidatus Binataceae bacterium]